MKTITTDAEIREYFGHNGTTCRVRVTKDGEVHRYGSPTDTDRSHDYWSWLGLRHHIVAMLNDGLDLS